MTLIVSSISNEFSVLSVDSAVTWFFEKKREYNTGRKAFSFPGVGIIGTWGSRNETFGEYLKRYDLVPGKASVTDLKDITFEFLTEVFQPHINDLDDVGYYVIGYDKDRNPHFYHVHWGTSSRNLESIEKKEYKIFVPNQNLETSLSFSYDGRFDLGHNFFNLLIEEYSTPTSDSFYDVHNWIGRVQVYDFLIRAASEITRQVSPPFLHFLISYENNISLVKNDTRNPVDMDSIQNKIIEVLNKRDLLNILLR